MSISNTPPPPLSNYGILSGQLFLYAGGRAAFESSSSPLVAKDELPTTTTKKCILIGGLGDGLLPVPYTHELERACQQQTNENGQNGQWSLVQPILSSSYLGFGHGSLARDCAELQELMQYLVDYRQAEEFCLVGHSTGCQDALYFLEHAASEWISKLRVVALQAPVSDREGAMSQDSYQTNLELAQSLATHDKGQERMPRAAHWAPITAQRFLDLNEKGGTDDYFSSDYTDEELCARLQHVGMTNNQDLKVLVAYSGADEYVPSHVDKSLLTDRLVAAMNSKCNNAENNGRSPPVVVAQRLFLETGNHNLSKGPGDGKLFVDTLAELLKSV
jgi:hypothetical protein